MQTFLLILEASLGTESRSNKILIDDEEESPILGYDYCADTIVKIVKGSIPNFSIGIYGDWGTGKSTLMKLVQKKITEQEKDDTIAWDDLEKKDEQSISKLKKFLMTNYNIHWIENLDLKVDDNKITISDNSNITNNHNKSTNKTLLLSPFQKIRQSISQHPPEKK